MEVVDGGKGGIRLIVIIMFNMGDLDFGNVDERCW